MTNHKALISETDFLKQVNEILEEMAGRVVLKNEHTFLWTDKEYIFKEYGELDYRRAMINAFMSDLRQGTKTYTYDICDKKNSSIQDITYYLTQESRNSEQTINIQLRLLHLLENPDELFIRLLELAHHKQDSHFLLSVFKKSINYGDISNDRNRELFTYTTYFYNRLFSEYHLDSTTIIDSFIHHIKNSQIVIDEVTLIKEFLEIFPENSLPLLLNAFNLDHEEVFVKAEEKAYSKLTLSLKALVVAKLNKMNINHIIECIETLELDFPKMVISHETAIHLTLLVEKDNIQNEKKVMMLFEQLVARKYKFRDDEKEEFKTLKELVKQINEVVYLNTTIDLGMDKKNKIKV
jgi:hypothetical protein